MRPPAPTLGQTPVAATRCRCGTRVPRSPERAGEGAWSLCAGAGRARGGAFPLAGTTVLPSRGSNGPETGQSPDFSPHFNAKRMKPTTYEEEHWAAGAAHPLPWGPPPYTSLLSRLSPL